MPLASNDIAQMDAISGMGAPALDVNAMDAVSGLGQPGPQGMLAAGGAALGRGLVNAAAEGPIGWLSEFPRAILQGVTRPAGAAYEALAEKTGLPEISENVAHVLTYPLGGDPDSATGKFQAAVNAAAPEAIKQETGINIGYQPQTKPEEYAASIGSALPYTAQGLPPASAVGMGVGGQAGSDITGVFTDNPAYKDVGRIVGGAGGAIAAPSAAEGIKDQFTTQAADTRPQQSIWANQSSDPFAQPNTTVKADIDTLYDKAEDYYGKADAGKPVVAAQTVQNGLKNINNTLAQTNFDPDFHPQTAKWLDKFQGALTDANGQPQDVTWTKLNGMRKLLNGIINDARKPMSEGGGYTEDGFQAIQARNALQGMFDGFQPKDIVSGDPNAIQYTKQGNVLYKAAQDADTLQRAIDKNVNKAVPSTSIATAMNNIVNNQKVFGRFTPEEQGIIQQAAKTGLVTGALRAMSSRLMSGIMGMATGGLEGGAIGVPLGYLAGETVRMPFEKMATGRQVGRVEKAISAVTERPAVQAALQGQPAPGPPARVPPSISAPVNPIAAITSGAIIPQQKQPEQGPALPLPAATAPVATIGPQSNAAPDQSQFYLNKVGQAENSTGNPNARNPNSTASGNFGFTDGTWAMQVAKYGKQTGITLADKNNPQAQAVMAKLLARDNIVSLQKSLGRLPTLGELYMAHALGADGAATLIQAQGSGRLAVTLFPPKVVMANRNWFFNGAQPRTAEQMYQLLASKV